MIFIIYPTIHDLKFSPNGNILVSASNDESLKFWEVDFDTTAKEVTLIKALINKELTSSGTLVRKRKKSLSSNN